jgi:hypothetical protein
MSYSLIPINQAVTFDAVTMDPGTGSVTDADSAPVYDVFEDTTDTPILSAQTMTKRTSKTGNYRGTFTASAANGFEAGKCYNVIASATVTNTVTSTAITSKKACLTFRCAPAEVQSGVPLADASYFAGQTITAAAGVTLPSSVASPTNITAGTITTVSGNVTGSVGSVTGAVGSVTGNVGGNVGGNVVGTVASVVDISTSTTAESSAVPSATDTLKNKLNWLCTLGRNKKTQTATTQLVRNDADNATIGTSTVSDDGTTFTRGKFS